MGRKTTQRQTKRMVKRSQNKKERKFENLTNDQLANITLEELINKISKSNNITPLEFKKVKQFSIKKNGFASLNNHLIIMKAFVRMCKSIGYPRKHLSSVIENSKNELRNFPHNLEGELVTLEKDLPRLVYFQYKRDPNFSKQNFILNQKEFSTTAISFIKKHQLDYNYSYYQGYLDYAVFYFILVGKNYFYKLYEIITETFFKDYISPTGTEVDNVFVIAMECLYEILIMLEPKLKGVLENNYVYLSSKLSCLTTFYVHEITDFNKVRRILDYLVVSEPITAYVLTALILLNNFEINEANYDEMDFEHLLKYICGINMNELDYDTMIEKCEKVKNINQNKIKNIQRKFTNRLRLISDTEFKGMESIINEYWETKEERRKFSFRRIIFILSIVILGLSYLIYYKWYM